MTSGGNKKMNSMGGDWKKIFNLNMGRLELLLLLLRGIPDKMTRGEIFMEIEKDNLAEDDKTETVLKVEFSSSLLIVTFLQDERFAGRRLVIEGEALSCGFDAYPSSTRWLKPHETEEIDDETRNYIVKKILEEKFSTGFKIIMSEG